jgi:hypothetical protein
MVVHVDDFAIAASNDEIVEQLLSVLPSRYTCMISVSV